MDAATQTPARAAPAAVPGMLGSLLADAPAQINARWWAPSDDWEQMRAYLEARRQSLWNWRTSWWTHWGEIAANTLPRRYHWVVTANQASRGGPINQDVVDSTPTQALLVCAAGMMDGLTPPSKNWFKLEPGIEDWPLDDEGRRWLQETQRRVYSVLAQSNFYDTLATGYEDQIAFGQSPITIYEHRSDVINCVLDCAGEYFLANGDDNKTDTKYREFTQTTTQIVNRWTAKAVIGTPVADAWNNKGPSLAQEFVVCHAIEPNFPADTAGERPNLGVIPGGYAWREYYWLKGQATPQPLEVRGFKERPFMCARWSMRSSDPYGRSPSMDALPDIRQLHQMTRRHAEIVDKGARPSMLADVSLKNEPATQIPGRVTYVANLAQNAGMKPLYVPDPNFVRFLDERIVVLQKRIERWYFNDVFMMINQMEGVQPRNELDLSLRQSERMMRLGTVIHRNLAELAHGISRVLSIMVSRGLIEPKPESLLGVPVAIKFTSKLAQLAEAAITASMERTLTVAGNMEAGLPGTLDNIDGDKFIRVYGSKLDFPEDCWRDEKDVAERRAQRDQQMQAAQAKESAGLVPGLTQGAKNLSETDTGGGISALQMLVGAGGGPQ